MTRIQNLTLTRLLDHAEDLAHRRAVGRASVEARAYAADAAGRVTAFGFPVPADDAGRRALGALLEAEMARRRAVVAVLALEARVGPHPAGAAAAGPEAQSDGGVECVVLEGRRLRPAARAEVRVLAIERRGRKIVRLRRLRRAASGLEPDGAAGAPAL